MSTIVTRADKGSALSHTEMDDNFSNLNNDKIQSDEATTFTVPQRTSITVPSSNDIDFTISNNFHFTATNADMGTPTTTGCTGQSGVIIIDSADQITGWDAKYIFKSDLPTLSDTETFAYFIQDESTIRVGRVA